MLKTKNCSSENMTRSASTLIEVLEAVERGKISCEEARSELDRNPLVDFPESEMISCLLSHYWDDEEIRQRDKDYRAMQNAELGKLIERLRQSDYSAAAKVSFLHVS
ncbi:MAG: hypothetical protein IPK22_05520 [Verrucomicrobiaceae bacterium]|nr:hypothetical protein [Verrucomicrobiaceae bacterium]